MKAITVIPGKPGSAQLTEMPEPPESDGSVLVETLSIGVCGTDIEILSGLYGWAPPGAERLILGHESLGRVIDAPSNSGLQKGQLVVGIVRRPDAVPCPSCAVDEWDMCLNGQYVERGIKERHGYASERYRIDPHFVVPLEPHLRETGVLLEPASVVAKAWEQIERVSARSHWKPQRVLVTGAGPIGLLAALMGVQRHLEVHVLDRVADGPKPELVRDLGAIYHSGALETATRRRPDIVIECTGVSQLVFDVMENIAPAGIVCLTGVSSGGHQLPIDMGALNRSLVLENNVVFGSVNANRRHYEQGAQALARADQRWLQRVLNRRVPLEQWTEAYTRGPKDVKVVVDFAQA